MSNAHGSKWIRPEKRLAIYARDGFACVYCGANEGESPLTLDHVLAREMGGTHNADNLVTCCFSCNSSKQDVPMRTWFATLRARGIDTSRLSIRIRTHLARPIDMNVGKQLRAARRA
jgi:5-methylcytosine-specific restriction endonuclease McrA